MTKKQLEFLHRYNIKPIQGASFGKQAIHALKKHALQKGGECLSEVYTKASDKYKWRCSENHTWESNWNNIQKNRWCPRCTNKVVYLSDLQEAAIKKGGKCLSEEYKKCASKYSWKCHKGHTWKASWTNIKSGHWCPYCAKTKPPSKSKVENIVKENQGVLLEFDYKNKYSKLLVKCRNNHEFYINWSDLRGGNWCKKCSCQGSSRMEDEIVNSFKDFKPVQNYRPPFLEGKEVDIYFSDYNLAVELHGLYWHSEKVLKENAKKAHEHKYLKCKENGVTLVQIFEDEWLYKKDIVCSILSNKLKINTTKIPARKCVAKVTTEHESFFENNHVAGNVRATKCWGLYYEGELVCALSLRKPFIKKHKGFIEIARFASKKGSNIIGGFSKLLKLAKNWAASEGFKGILTYADCRWGEGSVYLKAGFKHVGKTSPNYFYTNRRKRENRFKRRKVNNIKYIQKYGNTEVLQNASQNRYRIFDAGSNIYKLSIF